MSDSVITGVQLERFLPQRFPFLLLDQITAYQRNEWAQGSKVIGKYEPMLLDAGETTWPFEFVIESLGQLTIALINISGDFAKAPKILLGSVSGVTYHAPIELGCKLEMKVQLEVLNDDSFVTSGYAVTAGERKVTMDSLVAKIIMEE